MDVRVTVSHGTPSQLAVSQCVCRVAARPRAAAAGLSIATVYVYVRTWSTWSTHGQVHTVTIECRPPKAHDEAPRAVSIIMQRKMARCMPSCWRCVVLRCLLRYQLLYG